MADKNVEIALTTTGDTSGAEEVVDALDKVEEKIEQVEDASTEADDDLKKLVNIERARVVADIGKIFGTVASSIANVRKELGGSNQELDATLSKVETGLDAIGGGLAGAAQGFAVGGPMGAAIGGFIGLATGPLKSAFSDMIGSLKAADEATKRVAESEKFYQATLAARKEKLKELGFSEFWAKELAGITAATAALRRQNAEIESRRRVEDQRRESAQAAAAAGGAARGDVARADIIGDIESRLAAIEQKERSAVAAVELLGKAATDAELKAAEAAEKDLADADKLKAESKKARAAADEAQLDLESELKILADERESANIDLVNRVREETEKLNQDKVAQAKAIVDTVEASGAELDSQNRAALERVKATLEDGKLSLAESQQNATDLATVVATIRVNQQTQAGLIESLGEMNLGLENRLRALQSNFAALERRINTPGPNR
jgi:hypothetical protein